MDERDFEYVPLFGLHKKEEHVLRLVRGCGDNHHCPFSIIDFILKTRLHVSCHDDFLARDCLTRRLGIGQRMSG